jgi:hypothetical protein
VRLSQANPGSRIERLEAELARLRGHPPPGGGPGRTQPEFHPEVLELPEPVALAMGRRVIQTPLSIFCIDNHE